MMDENRTKNWMEITGGVREDFIEEAAQPKKRRSTLLRIASAAAVLALILGAFSLLQLEGSDGHNEPIPFFAVRAYAEDGTIEVLDEVGDEAIMVSFTSDLFPGKEVYILDISLGEYTGDPADIAEENFVFRHRGEYLVPGDSDEYLSIQWLNEEKDGIDGYRIIGWCEENEILADLIDIIIRDEEHILHQKSLTITNDGDYGVITDISYNYNPDYTTDELINAAFNQVFKDQIPDYGSLKRLHGGFAELEERPDAAQKMLELYVRHMNGKSVFIEDGIWGSNDWLLGMVLERDVHWNRLTQEEKELFCSYGLWRELDTETVEPAPHECFPGKKEFRYDLLLDGEKYYRSLTISYGDQTWPDNKEHFTVHWLVETRYHRSGWGIHGWFDEPTELVLTVTEEGAVVYQELILVTPTEDGYDIEVLETTE